MDKGKLDGESHNTSSSCTLFQRLQHPVLLGVTAILVTVIGVIVGHFFPVSKVVPNSRKTIFILAVVTGLVMSIFGLINTIQLAERRRFGAVALGVLLNLIVPIYVLLTKFIEGLYLGWLPLAIRNYLHLL